MRTATNVHASVPFRAVRQPRYVKDNIRAAPVHGAKRCGEWWKRVREGDLPPTGRDPPILVLSEGA